ncbi:NAD(P)/FAD-dependent oxidoreductase [Polaromonas sp.]|uniref:NAD(P)/FAD-dependent oxidoreductase n=1 Tax=Polaromonas sp. TaxID=1869339 RepID=UPI003564E659
MTQHVVIVGGGHAAAQLCASLTEEKFDGRVTMVSDERHLPYHRPPLSKTLIQDATAVLPELRGATLYQQQGVTLQLGTQVVAIDRDRRQLALSPGGTLPYDHLVLATGARARPLPDVPAGTAGVFYLRTFDDAVALKIHAAAAQQVLVLGGGFIGLELAATLRALGKQVTVVDSASRLMARAVSPGISAHVLNAHTANGISVRMAQPVAQVVVEQGRFRALVLGEETLEANMLIVGIGSLPNTGLAEAAGLACDNGVVVDEELRTSDAAISAIGDCASFHYPLWSQRLRLESVQNANQQARHVAARLCGARKPFLNMPWFWSDQGGIRLQMTGLWRPDYRSETSPANANGGFSIMHYENDTLRAVESINAAPEHLRARKSLQQST